MSYCTYLAANSSLPLKKWPDKDYPLEVNINPKTNTQTVFDGDADDNFALLPIGTDDAYSGKTTAVALCWNYYTEGRAKQVVEYIETALKECECVELWRVWLLGNNEEIVPSIQLNTISINELTTDMIREIDDYDVFDGVYNPHPVFRCLRIV